MFAIHYLQFVKVNDNTNKTKQNNYNNSNNYTKTNEISSGWQKEIPRRAHFFALISAGKQENAQQNGINGRINVNNILFICLFVFVFFSF